MTRNRTQSSVRVVCQGGCKRPVPGKVLINAAKRTLEAEQAFGDVIIYICSRREIRRLNREFRDNDSSTDVLSFSDDSDDSGSAVDSIALCADKVRLQALRFGHSKTREASFLIVHSVLHLLGYDHDYEHNSRDPATNEMQTRESEIMALLNV
ncbi:MAG: rRNA maturation RNase YbeY [Oscillospiraceae bacterium]|nr:rRNA maturation RNase YbeY [Oscillospiraceae bacterium]